MPLAPTEEQITIWRVTDLIKEIERDTDKLSLQLGGPISLGDLWNAEMRLWRIKQQLTHIVDSLV